ncbi:MAG: bifunctional oligoribonuclease/PAP phosphatase NrnA [Acidobacteriaceae bacterium]|nr:bifunctional oligoribonuclease/PAP phosphatase NrnA [Acidobacteriaceae bacterium]
MSPEAAIAAFLNAVRSHPRFIVTSHARPDGDACGSALGLAELLEQLGARTDIIFADPVPAVYRSLPGAERIRIADSVAEIVPDAAVPAILLECDGIARTGLKGLEGRILLNIDHHASGQHFGDLNWIDEDACACAAMVYQIARAAKAEITATMATCLYAGILSDTGSFTYPTTTAETFAMARDLALCGANPGAIARDIYLSKPVSRMRVLAASLGNLQCDGPVAWSWITHDEMEKAGGTAEDCEGIVNYLIGIVGIESAVFLREVPSANQFRLSIRSKGRVDVARVAEAFGGGGHRSASGCTLDGPLNTALERILPQLRNGLD